MRKAGGYSLLFLSIILLAVFRLDMRTDISDFFFTGDQPDAAFLINQLSADNLQRRTLLSIAHPEAEAEDVLEFMDQFQTQIKALEGVERVWSSALDEQSIDQILKTYADHQTHLMSLTPEASVPALFEPAELQKRVARIKDAILGPDPGRVKAMIQADPMLLTLDWLERVKSTFSRPIEADDYSILFLETRAAGMDIAAQEVVHLKIQQIFDQLNQTKNQGYQLATTGVPVFAMKIKAEVSRDIQRVTMFSSLAIMLLFILVFRAPKALMLTAFLLMVTVSGAVLITQSVFGFVHGLTLALGATLIGVCIDYFIHAMVHGAAQGTKNSLLSIRRIWPSLQLGGATTLIGYFALAASGFPGLQQIAVFSASGIVIALLITRFVLPDYIQLFQLRLQTGRGSTQLLALAKFKASRMIVPMIALGCFALGISNLKWSDDLQSLSPDLEQLKANDSIIRSHMTSIEPGRFILVEGEDSEQALQRSEQVYLQLTLLQEKGVVDTYFSVFPWLASEALQARNRQAWNQLIDSDIENQWSQALTENGLSSKAFPTLVRSNDEALLIESLMDTPVWRWLSRQIIEQDEKTLIVIWLGQHQPDALRQAMIKAPGARYFSQREGIDALATEYRHNAARMLIWGLLAILLLLVWRFRSATRALRVLSPAIISIAFVLGISGLMGTPLNMLHLVGLLLTAAICVDYGIFFSENRSGDHQIAFQAITASALTSAASFASLGVAQNPALQALAWTVAPGILIGFLLCPIMLKPDTRAEV